MNNSNINTLLILNKFFKVLLFLKMLMNIYGLCQKEFCFGINECAVFGLKYSQPKNSCYILS